MLASTPQPDPNSAPQVQAQTTAEETTPTHQSKAEFMMELVTALKGSETPLQIAELLKSASHTLSTFDAYRVIEVVLLSDRALPDKLNTLQALGGYIAQLSRHLDEVTPVNDEHLREHLLSVTQVRRFFNTLSTVQDALIPIIALPEAERPVALADLQDQLRDAYRTHGIPVEPREGYTDPKIPGRNFVA